MRQLIYFTVFGCGFYSWCLQAALMTLRHPQLGNYRGDVLVFTDDPVLLQTLPSSVWRQQYALPAGDQFYWSLRARFDAGLKVPAGYDKIMYCDVDVLFPNDVESMFTASTLHLCTEGMLLWRNQWAHAYLTADEMRDAQIAGTATINAGTIVMPGATASEFLGQWQAFVDADPNRQCLSHNQTPDQSALNAMVLRKQVHAQLMPAGWVVQPDLNCQYPNAKVLHFTGKRKDRDMADRLRSYMGTVQ